MPHTATLTLRSAAFSDGQRIPTKFTGDGPDHSPPLEWTDPPEGTREFCLIVDDPDAPTREPWAHWVLYRIPASARGLPEGVPPRKIHLGEPHGAVQGLNSWVATGYRGPAPPAGHGTHHYHFKLYALDTPLDIGPDADRAAVLRAMADCVLAKAELIGTYEREE